MLNVLICICLTGIIAIGIYVLFTKKKIQAHLAKNKMVDSTSDCFLILNSDFTIVAINQVFQNAFTELVKLQTGDNFLKVLDNNPFLGITSTELQEILDNTLTDQSQSLLEVYIKKEDFDKCFEIEAVYIDENRETGVLISLKDVTYQKKIQDMLLKQSRQQVELAQGILIQMKQDQSRLIEQVRLASLSQRMESIFYNMSNPLAYIESCVQLINVQLSDIASNVRSGTVAKKNIIEDIKTMKERCAGCEKKIRYIIDMKNTAATKSRQEEVNKRERFTIDNLINTVRFFAEDDIKKYKCDIQIINNVDNSVKIAGKEVSLVQALGNLITNSAQAYSKSGGKIEVTVNKNGGNIDFVVKDWAGGMPKDVKGKLLNEMVTTKGDEGNGIGVYASYLTIKDYFNGIMSVESTLGGGTTFHISIPCESQY